MTVQELLIQISSIASVEGEQVAEAEVRIDNGEEIQRALDLFYDKESNVIQINSVTIDEE